MNEGAASMPSYSPPDLQPLQDSDDLFRDDQPIEAYGLIGDCHGAALVGPDGSIDWCCFDRFDAEPLFARLLDRDKGGCFEIRPVGAAAVSRGYVGDTNLLRTDFRTDAGSVRLIDFMAVARHENAAAGDLTRLHPPGWIVRMLHGESGQVRLRLRYQPVGGGMALRTVALRTAGAAVEADGCPVTLHGDVEWRLQGGTALADITLGAGERLCLILAPAAWRRDGDPGELAERMYRDADAFWKEWSGHLGYEGPYRAAVMRSALALKLLTYSPTGAIVAAPTTSLPEGLGTPRTWDYRYCWPRDAALTLFALAKLGHIGEATRFLEFLIGRCRATLPRVPPLFGIDDASVLEETLHGHVRGWMGNGPVRTGNEAFRQHQIDVYGQIVDLAYLYVRLGGTLDDDARAVVSCLADHVAECWREPDAGIWEPRCEPQRHVHSAILSWVALDRAVELIGPRPAWIGARDAILDDIDRNAVHPEGGHLTQVFGGDAVDAALLVAPMVGLPIDDAVMARTVDRIKETLAEGPLVWRYRTDDGLEGEEGAFLLCSFWLVDALLALDRGAEARALFEALADRGNDLGLLSEQMGRDGRFLGNFPQAFTHLGVIHSALALSLYDRLGAAGIRGNHADRAERIVEHDARHRPTAARTTGWQARRSGRR